jgi:hypothetical protein
MPVRRAEVKANVGTVSHDGGGSLVARWQTENQPSEPLGTICYITWTSDPNQPAEAAAGGVSSPSMVGMSSDTVGWMCIAR